MRIVKPILLRQKPFWFINEVVLLSEDWINKKFFLYCLKDSEGEFGMRFASSKWKMPLHKYILFARKQICKATRFNYLGSYISSSSGKLEEVSSCIRKTRLEVTNLRYLWLWPDNRFPIKVRVYLAEVRSVLFQGSETWPLKSEVMWRHSVFEHSCLPVSRKI